MVFIMDIGKFYDTAKSFAKKIKEEKPNFVSDLNASVCLIAAENEEIFNGVTGLKLSGEAISVISAEKSAVMNMLVEGSVKAEGVIVVDCNSCEILKPTDESLKMLLEADESNENCEIAVSENAVQTIKEFLSADDSDTDDEEEEVQTEENAELDEDIEDAVSEEADKAAQAEAVDADETDDEGCLDDESAVDILSDLGEPAEFSSGVVIDESNPFYEPPAEKEDEEVPEIKVLYEQPGVESSEDKESKNDGKSAEEMLKDAKKKKKSAKKFNSFFKRGFKD